MFFEMFDERSFLMGSDFNEMIKTYTQKKISDSMDIYKINPELFDKFGVKRGLRDKNGEGVVAGITNISMIVSNKVVDGVKQPCEGQLYYRGYNVRDLVGDIHAKEEFIFEKVAYLLLFGELPKNNELTEFEKVLSDNRRLPTNFIRDVVMKAPSHDIMNSLTKSVLTLASYDDNVTDLSMENVLRQCLMLISTFPMLAVYGYHAYNYYECNGSFYIHRVDNNLSFAENILRMLRPDMQYTRLEAKVLDMALVLHMEHGGGNNSTFTTRVVTSAGSDTYSVIAAALSSLKGPKHGGANIKVIKMMEDMKSNIKDKNDEEEIKAYLMKILNKDAFDKRGLIYGMGHAVYSISDPRADILRGYVKRLAEEKHQEKEYDFYSKIERLAPEVISEHRHIYKGVSANVDFYSGFIYKMLNIPTELYTPIFAMARMVGWSAHRLEELANADKIMRPAYKSIMEIREYTED
jgi:citrate synthase